MAFDDFLAQLMSQPGGRGFGSDMTPYAPPPQLDPRLAGSYPVTQSTPIDPRIFIPGIVGALFRQWHLDRQEAERQRAVHRQKEREFRQGGGDTTYAPSPPGIPLLTPEELKKKGPRFF